MRRLWVTPDDFVVATGSQPVTADDVENLAACCDAVTGYIMRVRPDLRPPEVVAAGGGEFSVLASAKVPGMAAATGDSTVAWAALQLVKRWAKANAEGEQASFQALGFLPVSTDKDIEEQLQIGRSHRPVVA